MKGFKNKINRETLFASYGHGQHCFHIAIANAMVYLTIFKIHRISVKKKKKKKH